jgi:uncharacterized repeat protein (TIGR03803 family)
VRSGTIPLAALITLLLAATPSPAQDGQPPTTPVHFTTLFNFDGNGTNGLTPASPLAQGTDGNLYGTTFGKPYIGTSGNGTFFKISTSGKLTKLYNFCSEANCADGTWPDGPLVLGTDGNFYGITELGGTGAAGCPAVDCGTVFKITPTGALTTIHNWCSEPNCADGNYEFLTEPFTLMQANDGNFYEVNDAGGASGGGTAFKLTPSGKLTTIYNWCSNRTARMAGLAGEG